jgi:hypothetical protein
MTSVGRDIEDIVDDVERRGSGTECSKYKDCALPGLKFSVSVRGNDRYEDE